MRCAVRIGAVMTRKIYVAHGAIHNSGDYLIFHRGWDLLERFISAEDVELVPIKRWEPITGHCDALIILGGPIVSRKMHLQSNNIKTISRRMMSLSSLSVLASQELVILRQNPTSLTRTR